MTMPAEMGERAVDEVAATLARLYRALVANGVPETQATMIVIAWMLDMLRRTHTTGTA